MRVQRLTMATAFVVMSILPAHAAVIFSETQTGQQLSTNGNVTFFETGTVNGTSLDFTSGAAGFEGFLFTANLLSAASRGTLTATIVIDYDPLTSDNDFIFGLLDTTNIAGWERSDNDGGSWWTREGAVSGNQAPGAFVQKTTGLGTVDPFTMVYTIPEGPGATTMTITEGAQSFTHTFTFGLDEDAALRFFMAREGTGEDYRVNSVSITIDDAGAIAGVPEPGTLLLVGVGAALALCRRLRRPRA